MEKITEFTEEELAAGKEKLRQALIDGTLLREKKVAAEANEQDEDLIAPADLSELDELLYKTFEKYPKDVDPSGTPLAPGNPNLCLGSGGRDYFECCCDECPHFLKCFPEYEKQQKKLI